MFLLSLLSNSAAETVLDSPLPCRGARVTATLPREGQTNVPLDITPALLWSDDCGEGGVVTVTLELDDEEATRVYEGSVTTSGGETGMERITLPETLSRTPTTGSRSGTTGARPKCPSPPARR